MKMAFWYSLIFWYKGTFGVDVEKQNNPASKCHFILAYFSKPLVN